MPLKRFVIYLSLFALVLLALPRSAAAQTRSFYWESVDVDITLLENGDLRVVEQQTLIFSGGTFSFGFRTIPLARTDGIEEITVSEGGQLYTESPTNEPFTYEVSRSGDDIRVDWYFPPASGEHTYTFAYTVEGAVRVDEEGDQIFWKAIPEDHPARIEDVQVTIDLPPGVRPQVYTGTNDPLVAAYIDGQESDLVDITLADDGQRIIYDLEFGLGAGEALEVRAQFPSGLLAIETPAWQRAEQVQDFASLILLVVAGLLLIGGPLLVLLLWYTRGRDPEVGLVADIVAEPPSDLPPAMAGALVDEHADMQDVVATLLDLARRGYLIMEEEKRDHTFVRTDKVATDLRPYEQRFLSSLFGNRQSRSLKGLRYKFAEHLSGIQEELYEALVHEGLFRRSPDSTRSLYRGLGILLGVLAGASLFVLPALLGDNLGDALICLPIAIGATAVSLIIAGRHMPAKTAKGAELTAKWRAFKRYLQEIERYTNLEEATEVFEKYLPYAVAFGQERSWIRKFAAVPETPVPPWYIPTSRPVLVGTGGGIREGQPVPAGGGGRGPSVPTLEGMSGSLTGSLESMSSGLTRMLNNSATVLQSTRPSSGSGGSSSGGFSGGGGRSSGGGSMGFG